MEAFHDRLARLVDTRLGGNWAELGRRAGLNPSTIQSIKDGAEPRLGSLRRIAQALTISLDELCSGDDTTTPVTPIVLPRISRLRSEVDLPRDDFGIGEIMTLARLGSRRGAWLVLGRLSEGSATLDGLQGLCTGAGIASDELAATLNLLQRRNLIRAQGQQYELVQTTVDIRSSDEADAAQHTLECIRTLTRDIWPMLEARPREAGLTTARLRTTQAAAEEVARGLFKVVRQYLESHDMPAGDREITVVLGLATV